MRREGGDGPTNDAYAWGRAGYGDGLPRDEAGRSRVILVLVFGVPMRQGAIGTMRRMADPHEEAQQVPPVVPRVEEDHNCVGCSYNLRGLQTDGRCPECGYSIQRSLMGPLLRYSSAEYLKTLQQGVLLLIIAAFASVVIGIVATVLEAAIAGITINQGGVPGPGGGAGMAGPLAALNGAHAFVLFAVEALGAIVAIVGWYMLSVEDPSFVGTENGSKARRAVRILTMVRLAAVLGGLLFLGIDHLFQLSMAMSIAGGIVTEALPVLAWGAVMIVGMLYIEWLARRIPDEKMARQARRYAWLLPVIYIFLACCFGLGPLIALVLYVVLLFQLRAVLTKTMLWQESEEGLAVLERIRSE